MRNLFHFILTLHLLSASALGQRSTRGREFWLTYGENLDLNFNGPPQFSIIVSSPVNTAGTITVPYTGFSIPFIVTANQPLEVSLPSNIYYGQGDEALFNFGIRIDADDPVDVFTYHHRLFFSDASIVLPISELSTDYLVMAMTDLNINSPSQFVVLATRDSTLVEITPSVVTVSFRPPGVPFNVWLNEGQTFQLQAFGDLSGTRVRSLSGGKKIAVFGGARQGNVHCPGADNTLYDEGYSLERAGRQYTCVPFQGQGGDLFRIQAIQDSCVVSINGSQAATLNTGETFDTVLATPSHFSSTRLFLLCQFNKSQSCNTSSIGDPSMVNLVPSSFYKEDVSFISLDGPAGNQYTPSHFVNIVTPTSGAGLLMVDGTQQALNPVPSQPGLSYARVNLSAGPHRITSPAGFQAVAYGFGDYNAYTFHLGYDDPDSPVGLDESAEELPLVQWSIDSRELLVAWHGLNRPRELELLITDLTGRLCEAHRFRSEAVQRIRPALSTGLYLYRLSDDARMLRTGRLLVR